MRTASQNVAVVAAGAAGVSASAQNGAPTLFVDGVTGSLVGTIQLQARPAGGSAAMWQPIGGAGLSASGLINPGIIYGDMEFRVFCSAYTSGNAPCVFQVTA
jgi:hypothetical protein